MALPPGVAPTAPPLRRTAPASLLEAILESSREAILCLDAGGNVTTWSRGAELAYGYPANEAVGRPAQEFLIPEPARQEEAQARLAVLARGRVTRVQTARRRKDGSSAAVAVTMHPLRDPAGRIIGICQVECEAGEGRLADEVARLEERDRLRTDFLSQSAHELNTPLTPIRLQVQLLKDLPTLGPQERANVEAIERNVLRLGVLVQDMLDASRLQAGRLRLERVPLDLGFLAGEAADSFREPARKEGLRLDAVPAPRLMVSADPTRTMQVLFNLLSNALKFSRPGGRVEVGAHDEGGDAVVWVRDTGLGLTPEQLAGLFRPFGRVHEGQPGIPKGTGLGLFICRGIVEQQGGRIWAESPGPGQGTTVTFALPLATVAPTQAPVPSTPSEGPADSF